MKRGRDEDSDEEEAYPSRSDCEFVVKELTKLHGRPKKTISTSVLDSLIRTMLSQNTTDVTSHRAFTQLKERFSTWEECLQAEVAEVVKPIRCCGLADIRAGRIKKILIQLEEEKGELSLEYVRNMSDEAAKKELTRFKGVGPKTAACVLMFCLGRAEFPVDVHVLRIAMMMKWVPQKASRKQAYEQLNAVVPSDLKFDLHCLLVTHGKHCLRCAKNGKPRLKPHVDCPLVKKRSDRGIICKPGIRIKCEPLVKKKRRKLYKGRGIIVKPGKRIFPKYEYEVC